ncbi:MAG: molybdopterin-dependent oxidoreductase [Flexistipes sinusarabici]|uniref:Molybdopterin-dependent oxidoreductase n=1 Tax=Flexistipes sinusarabici TaxID=2352 RepID=A0A5D0MHB0_FLESI|nr:molybdopterin-dependent oxidoreductase [Flexistipes sinusarabici]TYB33114.1 MAG: molybdopterin-dependent oxidoreductase [Flexistipes sinusarabici]
MLTLTIDGIEVKVKEGSTILDAAKEAGVDIPLLCHHKMLHPFGACRVCLVEVEGSPKLMTACTTPAADKMNIFTQTEKLQRVRKTAIELLLINHPLDCPVCDKGGECTLQDLTFEFGINDERFDAEPNDTPVDHSNPFIERDIDRCVLCGKCVRICDEVVNIQAISFQNRGTDTIIGTSFDQPWHCEYCGQCMSVCPVGSLNNRVYLFKNRPWNLESTYSTCGFCSCGCTVVVDHQDNEVFRISEDPEAGINHGFLCAKGRFGFELFNSTKRKSKPMIKGKSGFSEKEYTDAIDFSADKIAKIKEEHGPESIGVIVSPRLTNEEAFLSQKFGRDVIGTNNIYSFETADALPEGTYEDVESSDYILVLNNDVTESNPILGLAVRRAARHNSAKLNVFYSKYTALRRVSSEFIKDNPKKVYEEIDDLVSTVESGKGNYKAMAEELSKAEKPVVIYDPYARKDIEFAKKLKNSVNNLITVPCKCKNNSQGIVDMGCFNGLAPGYKETEKGEGLREALETDKLKALIVFGENFATKAEFKDLTGSFKKLDFVMISDPFFSESAELADVYLPVATFTEKDGSFTNLEGRVQRITQAVEKGLPTDADIIGDISTKLSKELPRDIDSVRDIIKKENKLYSSISFDGEVIKYPYLFAEDIKDEKMDLASTGKYYLAPASLRLHSGSYTRHSSDLSKVYGEAMLEINPEDAKSLNVEEGEYLAVKVGDMTRKYKITIDKHVDKGTVFLPNDYNETAAVFHKGRYLKVDLVKHEA